MTGARPHGVIGGEGPRTVVYVHGIGNKPPPAILKCQWDRALFGAELGDRSRMAYWVNRDYYPAPFEQRCGDADLVRVDDDELPTRAVMALGAGERGDEDQAIAHELRALAGDDEAARRTLEAIANTMRHNLDDVPDDAFREIARPFGARVLPLPRALRRLLAGKLTRAFLRDVNDFLFDAGRREAMRAALRERLTSGGGPFVVIAHSQGSLIAYDVLRTFAAEECSVKLLVTIGSPLGLLEVQDEFRRWREGGLEIPPCVGRWVNVADRLDPVAIDGDLRGDYGGAIANHVRLGLNPDSPRHPHSATGYLRTREVQAVVREVVGPAFGQAVAPFVIAKDLSSELEDATAGERRPVLIQLRDDDGDATLDEMAHAITDEIAALIAVGDGDLEDAQVDRLRRFVSARLTRREVEGLRARRQSLPIKTMWRNSPKRALIHQSTHTIQAAPANIGYGADGRRINWAVLDTGIRADHPHFVNDTVPVGQPGRNLVVEQYDCLGQGPPVRLAPAQDDRRFERLDRNGHGTHVAGIISGGRDVMAPRLGRVALRGMAPRCRLYGFKVLDDEGVGSDAAIIKALDRIAEMNEAAGRMLIHGVNLSLGGSFDPSVYDAGHTPLCQELKRLWRQGVVVVLAAGNEGYAVLRTDGPDIQANLDMSIGDPANLEEAIAVGSVHTVNPVTFGVSFFSSRGPTADGRAKPDVVAPGERIISARHDWVRHEVDVPDLEDLYVELSGTSMAAPHVSGLIAAYLSLRREFIGEPDRVKAHLLAGCTDLKRDRYMQGAGLPNLIAMLALPST